MTKDKDYIYERWKDEIISQLNKQIIELNEIQEKRGYFTTFIIFVVCASFLLYLFFIEFLLYEKYVTINTIGFAILFASICFMLILVSQVSSMKGEIKRIIISSSSKNEEYISYNININNNDNYTQENINNIDSDKNKITDIDFKFFYKLYDVQKNTIDKLFDKLSTFSKTWLLVSGGIFSSIIIDILNTKINIFTELLIISCSCILWGYSQDSYGILNYELVKNTKELSLWWIKVISSK